MNREIENILTTIENNRDNMTEMSYKNLLDNLMILNNTINQEEDNEEEIYELTVPDSKLEKIYELIIFTILLFYILILMILVVKLLV